MIGEGKEKRLLIAEWPFVLSAIRATSEIPNSDQTRN